MAHRVETLERNIIGIIAGFAGTPRPSDERVPQTVSDLLLLFIENLLGHFLPQKPKVPDRGNQSEAYRFAWRKKQRAVIGIVLMSVEEGLDGLMREIAGREDVRDGRAVTSGDAAALCQVRFNKGS